MDKKRVASDESYKYDEVALDRKLLKHEAFVAELNFNAAQLDRINLDGETLIREKHYEAKKIKAILMSLNEEWNRLAELVKRKSQKLAEADGKKALVALINDAHLRLLEIERQLASDEQGKKVLFYFLIFFVFRKRPSRR